MLRGVSGNARKKITIVRKMIRKKDRTSVDPSLSGNWALDHIANKCVYQHLPESLEPNRGSHASYTGAELWASTFWKGPRSAAQSRTGATSHVDRQPPPSTSPFPDGSDGHWWCSTEDGRRSAAIAMSSHLQLAAPGTSLQQHRSTHTSASQHSSPRPHAPGVRWG